MLGVGLPLGLNRQNNGSGSIPSSLLTGIKAYWKLDEVSGDRVDQLGISLLTDINTVTSAAGKINLAGSFASASSEALTALSNANLALPNTDADFHISLWINLATAGGKTFLCKSVAGLGNNIEYRVRVPASLIGNFEVGTGAALSLVAASVFGAFSTATWYNMQCWRDATLNTINISVNDNAPQAAANAANLAATGGFALGRNGEATSGSMNGLIDEVGIWNRVLTSGERTSLYNAGNGLSYPF